MTLTSSGRPSHAVLLTCYAVVWVRNPDEQAHRFGLFRVRSPLLAESLLISFPAGTEMFHFPACRLWYLFIQ